MQNLEVHNPTRIVFGRVAVPAPAPALGARVDVTPDVAHCVLEAAL